MTAYLRKHGILTKISERVRFARRRFGQYEVIDFMAVLFGYAIRSERTLEEFYERLRPFEVAFMAVFERDRLPSRSALSRFLAALTPEPVEALRTLFLKDLLERRADFERLPCGLSDRIGNRWLVFDIDGTREAARPRALPKGPQLPLPQRRTECNRQQPLPLLPHNLHILPLVFLIYLLCPFCPGQRPQIHRS